jgi:hypothetical protein
LRLRAATNWLVAFFGRGRSLRVITAKQVFAREAHQVQAAAITAAVSASPGEGFQKYHS